MDRKIKMDAVDHPLDAILTPKNPERCYKFLEDAYMINELLPLSQCHEVARVLREGKTYLEIADKTGTSAAIVNRVNRSLSYGGGGYNMVFSRPQMDCRTGEPENREQADVLEHEILRARKKQIIRRMGGWNIRSSFIDLNLSLN